MRTVKYLVALLILFLILLPTTVSAYYIPGQTINVQTTVKDVDGVAVTNATVTLDIYNPSAVLIVNDAAMNHVANGVYEYGWTIPASVGTYFCVASAVGYGYDTMSYPVYYSSANVTVNASAHVDSDEIWGVNMSGYTDTATFGGILNDIFGGNMKELLVFLLFPMGLLGFALWKRGWLRILLSICIIIWGIYAVSYDIRIAVPFIAIGPILFIQEIISQIQHARGKPK